MSLLPPSTHSANSNTTRGHEGAVRLRQHQNHNGSDCCSDGVSGHCLTLDSMVWGRVLRSSIPLLLGRRPSGPQLPGANPPGSAGSTCAHRLRGLPQPPVFFRPKERGLRKITLGRILTERCEPDSSQQEQGKSQMALHLNEPTTMASTVAHADGWSFLGLVVITAHLSRPVLKTLYLE